MSSETRMAVGPILVTDDDLVSRALLRAFFQRMQLHNPVVEASDGAEAIGYLEQVEAGQAEAPALIILDLHMPGTSGLDVLRWRSDRPAVSTIPVVMLTGSTSGDQIEDAYRLGVLSYLVKPVGYTALNEVLRNQSVPWAILCSPVPAAARSTSHDRNR